MNEIATARHRFKADIRDVITNGIIGQMARRAGVTLPPLEHVANEMPLEARVDHGRWIVDCPDCSGAEYVWDDVLLMQCCSCWNQGVGRKWRRVSITPQRPQIESILKARPQTENRNWRSDESLTKLRGENRARGLPEGV